MHKETVLIFSVFPINVHLYKTCNVKSLKVQKFHVEHQFFFFFFNTMKALMAVFMLRDVFEERKKLFNIGYSF